MKDAASMTGASGAGGLFPLALLGAPALLVTGGCRSGKSRMALDWAKLHDGPRGFIATAEARDAEMAARIRRHQEDRGPEWRAFVAPLDPLAALHEAAESCRVAVLDCVTVWLSNLMLAHPDWPDSALLAEAERLAESLRRPPLPVAVVTNETGQGVVPASALGRRFRDLHGEANQLLASACPAVLLAVCGLPLILKQQSD